MDGPKKRKLAEDTTDSALAFPSRGALKKILEVVGSDQVVDLVLTAAALHRDFLEVINDVVGKDSASRKLFVRGLGFDTTNDTLREAFVVHGEVVEGIVIINKLTGKSRGFGFVTFRDLHGALSALTQPTRVIDGRFTTCQLAAAGSQQLAAQPEDVASRKIYVGNVPASSTFENLKSLFSQFGEIEDGPIGFDKVTQKSRGYGLILYKSEESAKRALESTGLKIDGQDLFCKLATDSGKARPRPPDTSALLSYSTATPAGYPGGMSPQVAGYNGSQYPYPLQPLNSNPQNPLAPQMPSLVRYHPPDNGMAPNFYTPPLPTYPPATSLAYPPAIMTIPGGSQAVVGANGQQYLQQQQPQYVLQSENGALMQQTHGGNVMVPRPGPHPLLPQTPNSHLSHPQHPQPLQPASILGTPTPSNLPSYASPPVYQHHHQYVSYEQQAVPQQPLTGGVATSQMQNQAPPVTSQIRPT